MSLGETYVSLRPLTRQVALICLLRVPMQLCIATASLSPPHSYPVALQAAPRHGRGCARRR
jgi:hypothetical protein